MERGCIWQITPKMSRDLVEVRGICSRTRESGHALARESQLAFVTDDCASLLAREDIDVVDICVPPALHHDFAIRAADAGKHIIMEKPLTGYFGAEGDPEPIGTRVPRSRMREGARNNAEAVREAYFSESNAPKTAPGFVQDL